jgi:uncharacterized membrane protein YraQ (UPF0718 family)
MTEKSHGERTRGGPGGRGRGGWIFLAIMVGLHGVVALFDTGAAARSLEVFAGLLGNVVPALAVVVLLLFLVELLLNPKRVEKYLGRRSGLRGWAVALAAGVLSTGPVYAAYAVLRDLREKGMRPSLMAALLYARAVKLPLLPLLLHYFGLAYTGLLVFWILAFAVLGGLVMGRVEEG